MVAQSNAIGGPWEVAKIAATGLHVLATCAWLGGLLALATVLIPGEKMQELDQLIPRFSRVAQLSAVTLIVTGIVHALAVAGGVYQLASSRYGLVLLIKVSNLRPDAADGQRGSQVRGARRVPSAASAVSPCR
jgi:putative copper export protein